MFESSLSASTMRPPLSTALAPSLAESLPTVNFGFDELRQQMATFTDHFDSFIAKQRKRVLEERNQFRIAVAELQGSLLQFPCPWNARSIMLILCTEDQRNRVKDLETLAQKSSQHLASVSAQEAETAEMHEAIATITSQRDAHASHRENICREIAGVKQRISACKAAQSSHAQALDKQSRLNVPELSFWENYLGLRIEGAGRVDRLKFILTNLDERDWKKEAWFVLDTENPDYRVITCEPQMDESELDTHVERLNDSRDLGIFLRGFRESFCRVMR